MPFVGAFNYAPAELWELISDRPFARCFVSANLRKFAAQFHCKRKAYLDDYETSVTGDVFHAVI